MWLVGHVIALIAIVGFVLLGLWQLDRHAARSAFDTTLRSRLAEPAVSLESLLGDNVDLEDVEYRQATVTGTYATGEEVILQARSLEGRSGHEVLTPLILTDGSVLIVDRGWVPIDVEGPPVVGAEPPSGEVAIRGYVRQTQVRSGLGPVDPPTGDLDRVSRVDLDRLGMQMDQPVQPIWLQLADQQPPQAGFPLLLPPPTPGGGPPHLSYAIQWFAFAVLVVVAYPFLLRRTAARIVSNQEETAS